MSGRAFGDTNLFVYAYDADEPVKRARAQEVIGSLEPGSLVVSTQVLGEFYTAVTRKLARPLPAAEAAEAVDSLSRLPTVHVDAQMVRDAVRLAQERRLSYWDALLVVAASVAGCDRILTEDLDDGAVLAGVRVENPFRSA